MSRVVEKEVQERNAEMVRRFKDNKNLRVTHLAAEYGLSVVTVKKILRSHQAYEQRAKQGPVAMDPDNPISYQHMRIGQEISYRRTFGLKLTVSALGKRAQLSRFKLARAEFGCHDWQLTELQRM